MNETGILKHRVRILVFRRRTAPAQDELGFRSVPTLVAHVVTSRHRFEATLRRLDRRFFGFDHSFWAVDEPYWRKHGFAGRPR